MESVGCIYVFSHAYACMCIMITVAEDTISLKNVRVDRLRRGGRERTLEEGKGIKLCDYILVQNVF